MRSLVLGLLTGVLAPLAIGQTSIRQIDFKNFSYPLKDHLLGHGELKWLAGEGQAGPRLRMIHLSNGEDLTKESSLLVDGKEYAQYSGFEFQSVSYGDLVGDGKEDAIVVLRYLTGGTQTTNYVYFYALENGKPRLLAYCHTGDRAYSGLYGVYSDHESLVVELFDPNRQEGDCCSSGIVRMRYRWNGSRFVQVGSIQHLPLKQQHD